MSRRSVWPACRPFFAVGATGNLQPIPVPGQIQLAKADAPASEIRVTVRAEGGPLDHSLPVERGASTARSQGRREPETGNGIGVIWASAEPSITAERTHSRITDT